jgi:hypothetical protein
MWIESEARGPVVGFLGCSRLCYLKDGYTCPTEYCICQPEVTSTFRHCCPTCFGSEEEFLSRGNKTGGESLISRVGPVCYCPHKPEDCQTALCV